MAFSLSNFSTGNLSNQTFGDLGSAVSDLFAAQADRLKAQGDEFEKQSYLEAATLAGQNELFTEQSTALQQTAADRQLYQALGKTTSGVAAAGFATSGSALDLLRKSAGQGATARAVLGSQGQILEAGYAEQQASYQNMASAANVAEEADKQAATGADISAGISAVAGIATLGIKA